MIRKLTTIIVISFVAINALFLIGICLTSYKVFFNVTSEDISETRLALLNESAKNMSSYINSVSEAGKYIASNQSAVQTFSEEITTPYEAIVEQRELTGLLNGVVNLKRDIYSIKLYTDRYNGFPLIQEEVIYPIESIEEEPWFDLFERMDGGWIPKHNSLYNNEEIISYVHLMRDQTGDTTGYLKVNVLADSFFEYMSDEGVSDDIDEALILLNSGGRIIAQTSSPEFQSALAGITKSVPEEPYDSLKERYNGLSNHRQIVNYNSEPYMLLISEPNYDQWRLVQLIPINSLFAEIREVGWLVLFLGILGLLLSIPFVYWVGKKIIEPMRKIILGMKNVEKGKFNTSVGPFYIEEYNVLAKNFNNMTSQLDESVKKLKTANNQMREAELRALQSQITPHFLYNTLDMIHWKAMDHHAEDISFMVNQLSKMLRIGLSDGKKLILFRDELEHAKSYIQIQRARLPKDIVYRVNVPASIKDLYVPKIILQPFIENSMLHGYPESFRETIHIHVQAKLVREQGKDMLEIIIDDEGAGLPEEWDINDLKGVGINNVRDRVWLYCGKPYGLQLSKRAEIGTSVRIILPVIKNQEELNKWMQNQQQRFDAI